MELKNREVREQPSPAPPLSAPQLGGDGDLGAQAQVWRCGEQSGMVEAEVSGDGGCMLGLQRGAGDETGGDSTGQALVSSATPSSVEDVYRAKNMV